MAKTVLLCKGCGHKETLNKRFFIKLLGGAVAGGGFYAWIAYLLAGTGLALPICIAILTGGVAIAAFSDEIAEWVSKKYACPKCKAKNWKVAVEE